mgnify:CR=1 FL=1
MIFTVATSPTGMNINSSVDLVGIVVVPTVNVGSAGTDVPTQVTNFVCCMPAKNELGTTTISVGDIGPGVDNGQMLMMNRHATFKATYFLDFMPANAMLNVSLPNGIPPSGIGAELSPSQIKQMLLMPL